MTRRITSPGPAADMTYPGLPREFVDLLNLVSFEDQGNYAYLAELLGELARRREGRAWPAREDSMDGMDPSPDGRCLNCGADMPSSSAPVGTPTAPHKVHTLMGELMKPFPTLVEVQRRYSMQSEHDNSLACVICNGAKPRSAFVCDLCWDKAGRGACLSDEALGNTPRRIADIYAALQKLPSSVRALHGVGKDPDIVAAGAATKKDFTGLKLPEAGVTGWVGRKKS